MNNTKKPPEPSLCDLMVWPDGEWCFRDEYPEIPFKSDDYQIIYHGTEEYNNFMKERAIDGY